MAEEDKPSSSYWSRAWRYIVNDASLSIMILGAGLLIGWRVTAEPQSSSTHLKVWWPLGFLALFIAGTALYAIKIDKKIRRNPKSVDTVDVYEEVVGMREQMGLLIESATREGKMTVVKGEAALRTITGVVVVPVGGMAATAVGVPSVKVTVPSGRQFGADPDKPFEFFLPPGPQNIKLEDGGTVSITGPGSIAPDGTARINVKDLGNQT
jgi:hypothetical protein